MAFADMIGEKKPGLSLRKADLGVQNHGNLTELSGDVSLVLSGTPQSLEAAQETLRHDMTVTTELRERPTTYRDEWRDEGVVDLVVTKKDAYPPANNFDRDAYPASRAEALKQAAELLAQVHDQIEFDIGARATVAQVKEGGAEITTRFDGNNATTGAVVITSLANKVRDAGYSFGMGGHADTPDLLRVRIEEDRQGDPKVQQEASRALVKEVTKQLGLSTRQL